MEKNIGLTDTEDKILFIRMVGTLLQEKPQFEDTLMFLLKEGIDYKFVLDELYRVARQDDYDSMVILLIRLKCNLERIIIDLKEETCI